MFSQCRKENIFDYERHSTGRFNYNFLLMAATGFKTTPEKLAPPIELSFEATEDQKSYLRHQLFMQGSHLAGKTKMLGRMPVSKLHRPAVLAADEMTSTLSAERLAA